MALNLISSENISFILVFIEGLISFFSPCIIPLLPVYMSYLAGNVKEEVGGVIKYKRKTVFLHTVFFVLGISFAFFILLIAFTAVGGFFSRYQNLFMRVSGIIIIVLGLYQLGVFNFKLFQKQSKLNLSFLDKKMNPIVAFIMGFTFSFAWTPCIGPMLSSVLILASTAKNITIGVILMLIYTIGFTIPFLLLGLFTTKILEFLNRKRNLLKYTIKIGGVILVIIGIMTFTGWMNGVSGYLTSITNDWLGISDESPQANTEDSGEQVLPSVNEDETEETSGEQEETIDKTEDQTENQEPTYVPAIEFTLTDQYGNEHTLSDYKGKAVFLNFWATGCLYCKQEMPDIEKLYKEYNLNQEEVVIIGVVNPRTEENISLIKRLIG